jgi:hypothetical protein
MLIEFVRTHSLMVDPANCRLVQAGGRVFPNTAVTSRPTASVTGVIIYWDVERFRRLGSF